MDNIPEPVPFEQRRGAVALAVILITIAAASTLFAVHLFSSDPETQKPRDDVVRVEIISEGSGSRPREDDVVLVNFEGRLDGELVFDKGENSPMSLEAAVPGLSEGMIQLKKGGHYKIHIPAAKAYGASGLRDPQTDALLVPANSDVVYEIELLDFMPKETFEKRMELMERMRNLMPEE